MRNWVGDCKKTSHLCLGTLFRSVHAKFQVRGCSGCETVALAPNVLKQIPLFSGSPLRPKSMHYALEHHAVQLILLFFLVKISPFMKIEEWLMPGSIQCPGSVKKCPSSENVIYPTQPVVSKFTGIFMLWKYR